MPLRHEKNTCTVFSVIQFLTQLPSLARTSKTLDNSIFCSILHTQLCLLTGWKCAMQAISACTVAMAMRARTNNFDCRPGRLYGIIYGIIFLHVVLCYCITVSCSLYNDNAKKIHNSHRPDGQYPRI